MANTHDMNLELPTSDAENAGQSINANSQKIEKRTFKFVCGESIDEYDVVAMYYDSGNWRVFQAQAQAGTPPIESTAVRGFALSGGIVDEEIFVQYLGRLQNPSWSFSSSERIWLSTTKGQIVQGKPGSVVSVMLGMPVAEDEIAINIVPFDL